MKKIAVLGASGNAGSRIVREAQLRGHMVTAFARNPSNYQSQSGEECRKGDVQDIDELSRALAGHDVVISSVTFVETDPKRLIQAIRNSGVVRFLCVGGAGSLWIEPGMLFIDHPEFPAFVLEESRCGKALLEHLRAVDDIDWTMIAPSAYFEPGERTGKFRLGQDDLLVDDNGRSWITYEDLAVAMIDEVEEPRAIRKRITVGY